MSPLSIRSASRSSRLARLRATAPPTFLLTTKPARGGPPSARLLVYRTMLPVACERPPGNTDRNPPGELRRASVAIGSGRQPVAALGASPGEDGTAGTGPHPQAEAVCLGALTIVRLEGSLHDIP